MEVLLDKPRHEDVYSPQGHKKTISLDAVLSITNAAVQSLEKSLVSTKSGSLQNSAQTMSPVSDKGSHSMKNITPLSPTVINHVYSSEDTFAEGNSQLEPSYPQYVTENTADNNNSRHSLINTGQSKTEQDLSNLEEKGTNLNSSVNSRVSLGSTASSTFLTGEAKPVRISSKKLKEIDSPFDIGDDDLSKMSQSSAKHIVPGNVKKPSVVDDVTRQNHNYNFLTMLANETLDNSRDLNRTEDNASVVSASSSVTGNKVKEVSVVKHHSMRKHTTEHNHSFLVEKHRPDRNTQVRESSNKYSSASDSGYTSKAVPMTKLDGSCTNIHEMNSATGIPNFSLKFIHPVHCAIFSLSQTLFLCKHKNELSVDMAWCPFGQHSCLKNLTP